jgi:NAD(P)-dependent dehydrogenase (short-subunit alcohol dehydrogenase family)
MGFGSRLNPSYRPPHPIVMEDVFVKARDQTVAVIGAGDYIGAEIAKKFASEGFSVFAGRRNGDKLAPLASEIEAAGGSVFARSLDARKEEEIVSFLSDADQHAPLEVCVFNIGANVNFPLLDTTERVFRKVWEMACYAGFLSAREAARRMLPHGRGSIFFTGATASLRGGVATRRSPAPSSACARWRRPRPASCGRGTSTSRISSLIPGSTPSG